MIVEIKSIFKNRFYRSVSVLVSGTVFSQLLVVLSLPIITRLYSPEEFGVFGVFFAFLTMVSIVAGMRYEIGIPIPESDEQAVSLLSLALLCVIGTSLLAGLIVIFFSNTIARMVDIQELADYLILLPFAVAVTGAYNALVYWAIRKKAFGVIAFTRVGQGFGCVTTQVTLGWAGAGSIGLIVGQIVSNGVGLIGLLKSAVREDWKIIQNIKVADIKSVSREYIRYPKYSVVEALANSASIQMPLILIASMVASEEVGFLLLATRIMQAPISLVGSSVSQVYFSNAVHEHRNGQLGEYTAQILNRLLRLGVGPIIFLGIVSPPIFSYLFGAEWTRAGVLVAWMSPWFIFQFLASPASMSLHVTNNQRIALVLQVLGLLLRLLAIICASVFLDAFVSEAYAVSGFVFYFVYLLIICHISKISLGTMVFHLRRSFLFIIVWVALGILVLFFM